MQQVLDLHIHSKYSRACSKSLTLKNIEATCTRKGVDIISTGDFTHPTWLKSICNELIEINTSGLYQLRNSDTPPIKFILGTEVSLVYKDNDKCRRLHLCIHAPNINAALDLNNYLDLRYNIRSDGRPILGISAPEFVKICLKIDPRFLIYPAHIWTPWFSMFGTKSGFQTLEECFHDQSKYIYAYETGLSSDPEMNWRVSQLDNLTLLSSSDAHSLESIAREATIFDLENITYTEIYDAIKNKNLKKIKSTIEFYPEEGMYHISGHKKCKFSCSTITAKKLNNTCPVCNKTLTLGVDFRVDEIADRAPGIRPINSYGFKKIVELDKIIAQALNIKNRKSKKVAIEYNNLISKFGNELNVLLNIPITEIKKNTLPSISKRIKKMRDGEIHIQPGFDGEYGVINI